METPPWHIRTIFKAAGEEGPITTLLDAIQRYADLPLPGREQATVSVVEPGQEGDLTHEEIEALIAQLPSPA